MENKHIEPGFCVLDWSLKLDGFLLERKVQPFVLNVTQPVQSHFRRSFLEEYRSDLNFLNIFYLAKVVEVVINACLIETWKHVKASWIIVIAMNAENRQSYW